MNEIDLGPQRQPKSVTQVNAEWKYVQKEVKEIMQLNLIERCMAFAKEKHKGQKRWGGEDYFDNHIMGVYKIAMDLMNRYGLGSAEHKYKILCAALLHDVLEDTDATEQDILDIHPDLLRLVKALTKIDGEGYDMFIERIAECGTYATIVKMADLTHNMSDLDKNKNMYIKYRLAYMYLELTLDN